MGTNILPNWRKRLDERVSHKKSILATLDKEIQTLNLYGKFYSISSPTTSPTHLAKVYNKLDHTLFSTEGDDIRDVVLDLYDAVSVGVKELCDTIVIQDVWRSPELRYFDFGEHTADAKKLETICDIDVYEMDCGTQWLVCLDPREFTGYESPYQGYGKSVGEAFEVAYKELAEFALGFIKHHYPD